MHHLPKNQLSEKYFKKRYDAYEYFYRNGNAAVTQREGDQRISDMHSFSQTGCPVTWAGSQSFNRKVTRFIRHVFRMRSDKVDR